jgi:hypothetical protein
MYFIKTIVIKFKKIKNHIKLVEVLFISEVTAIFALAEGVIIVAVPVLEKGIDC